MTNRVALILVDVLYAILIVLLLLPTGSSDLGKIPRIVIIILAVAQRIWRHVNYYKRVGKIY